MDLKVFYARARWNLSSGRFGTDRCRKVALSFVSIMFSREYSRFRDRSLTLTPAIFIAANASHALTRKPARRFNESVIFSRGHYAQLFHNCAQFLPLRERVLYNGAVTVHRPLIFRACHRNSISARRPTTTRNSNSVSVVASINYGTGQLARNN